MNDTIWLLRSDKTAFYSTSNYWFALLDHDASKEARLQEERFASEAAIISLKIAPDRATQ